MKSADNRREAHPVTFRNGKEVFQGWQLELIVNGKAIVMATHATREDAEFWCGVKRMEAA